jgi:membrane associated rhomboid family serine protease
MSAFFRATRAVRSCPSPRAPFSSTFFSVSGPRKSLPSNPLRPSSSPTLPSLRHARFYSGGSYAGGTSANMNLIYGIIGVNTAIFGYAAYAKMQAKQGYFENLIQFMQHFTLNVTEFKNGRWYQTITSVFTHTDLFHYLGNMVSFYFLGQFLATTPLITPGRFLIIALGSGFTGSLFYLFNHQQKAQRNGGMDHTRGLGFSGAIMGVSAVAACLYPTAKVHLYGLIPVPLWGLVAGYAIYDGYYLNENKSRISHSGHLGGLAFGLVYYLARLRFRRF